MISGRLISRSVAAPPYWSVKLEALKGKDNNLKPFLLAKFQRAWPHRCFRVPEFAEIKVRACFQNCPYCALCSRGKLTKSQNLESTLKGITHNMRENEHTRPGVGVYKVSVES